MKVAIYCRLSDEDRNKKKEEDDSESIQNQKSMLISYAMQNEWEIYDIYSEEDYTGSDRSRPKFNQLLEDAENRKFNIILCKTQSRFTREMELVEKYIHTLFPLWGIRFIGVVDNADTDVKGNKKSRQINGLVNEWYLEDLSENIRGVFKSKTSKGQHIGSFAPYGYIRDPEKKGQLVIDDNASKVVREIFDLYTQGFGKTQIARILNQKDIPNPTMYKIQQGLKYYSPHIKKGQGVYWNYSSICTIIKNEMYIGNMVQGKAKKISYKSDKKVSLPKDEWVVVENTHEPIIDIDLWNKVQSMLKDRAKPFDTGKIGLFSKKVKCLHCGYNLRSVNKYVKGKYLKYLRCESRYSYGNVCIGSMISVDRLERIVLAELKKLVDEYLDKELVAQKVQFNDNLCKQKESLKNDIRVYKEKTKLCSTGIKNLYLDKTKGMITDDEFIDLSKDFHGDKKIFETLIEEMEEQLITLDEKQNQAQDIYQIIDKYTNINNLNREIVLELIDYIEVGHRYENSKNRPVKIHWNF